MKNPRLDFGATVAHFGNLFNCFDSLLVSFRRPLAYVWLPFGFLGVTFGNPGARCLLMKAPGVFFIFLYIFNVFFKIRTANQIVGKPNPIVPNVSQQKEQTIFRTPSLHGQKSKPFLSVYETTRGCPVGSKEVRPFASSQSYS